MKTFVVTLMTGDAHEVSAKHFEAATSVVVFYDEIGRVTAAFTEWSTVIEKKPEGA